MARTHRLLVFTVRLVILAIAGRCLLGDLQAFQREGDSAVLTDRPRCRFAWPPDWDYTTIPGALILTKNTLDKSMIGIMRVHAGDTLTLGKTKVAASMSTRQIAALLRESVQRRKERVESLTFVDTTVAGVPAVGMQYIQLAPRVRKRAVEYRLRGRWLLLSSFLSGSRRSGSGAAVERLSEGRLYIQDPREHDEQA